MSIRRLLGLRQLHPSSARPGRDGLTARRPGVCCRNAGSRRKRHPRTTGHSDVLPPPRPTARTSATLGPPSGAGFRPAVLVRESNPLEAALQAAAVPSGSRAVSRLKAESGRLKAESGERGAEEVVSGGLASTTFRFRLSAFSVSSPGVEPGTDARRWSLDLRTPRVQGSTTLRGHFSQHPAEAIAGRSGARACSRSAPCLAGR